MTLSIQTNQLKTRKKVEIDGHPYTVRKFGNIEQLDLSQYMRRLNKLAEIEKTKERELTDADFNEVDELTKKMTDLFVSLFDDGGDQSKSYNLVSSLSTDEITIMLTQIFGEDNKEKTNAGSADKATDK